MRIAITGSSCQGKSTLIKDMLKEWPTMSTPDESYRDIISKYDHSKNTDEDIQWDILNHMCDIQQQYRNNDRVIFDRCPIDNIVHSMWSNFHGTISDEFIEKCIPIVRESMRFIDIIFFLPITSVAPVAIEEKSDESRETDPEYIKEIDSLIKTMYKQWQSDGSPFFPKDDKPAMIEIFGNRQERIEMLKLYIDVDGDAISEGGIIDPGEMEELQKMFGIT